VLGDALYGFPNLGCRIGVLHRENLSGIGRTTVPGLICQNILADAYIGAGQRAALHTASGKGLYG